MSRTALRGRKFILALAAAVLGLAGMPAVSVQALGVNAPVASPTADERPEEHLERIWLRQQREHHRLTFMFDHVSGQIQRMQERIDRAAADGKDASALQAALDAFEKAVQEARPSFESAKGIIAAHKGFDENGSVTDLDTARQTVEAMAGKLRDVRETIGAAARAMRDALLDFRAVNRPR